MALTSRAQRERDQHKRMLRGKRNLTQLVGPQAQGQRTPMNRGSGYVNTVQAPKFPQSNVGADITTAGLAYKGGEGLFDWTQGKEAYTDKAGNVVPEVKPFAMPDVSGRLGQLNTNLGNFGKNVMNMEPGYAIGKDGTLSSSMFGAPWEPLSMGGSSLGGSVGGGMLSTPQSPFIPLTGGASSGVLAPGSLGGSVANSSIVPSTGLGTTSGLNLAGTNALQGPANATELAAEAGAGSDLMGGAGAALGAGLNIYDMTQQGVTAGNALGLGGSALLGLSNAWNPLGWAMLGTSAAGSLFDWW